jgi:polysaccharide pyruvyl transferase WcaK-like protein
VWSGNDDTIPLGRIHEKFAHTGRVVMIADAPAPVLKGCIARCRFFVAARTHASVAAYSESVPTLVAGYSVKARGIARDIFGTERDYVVPVQSMCGGGELVAAFENMRRREEAIRRHYESAMAEYKAAALTAKQHVTKL